MKTITKLFISALLMAGFSTTSNAETLTMLPPTAGLDTQVDVWFNLAGMDTHTDKFNINLSGYNSVAFCVEVGPSTSSGKVTLRDTPPLGNLWTDITSTGSVYYASWLMDQFNPAFNNNYQTVTFNGQFSGSQVGVTEQIAYAGLQLAIWEATYDGYVQGVTGYDSFFAVSSEIFSNGLNPALSGEELGGSNEKLAWDLATYYMEQLAANDPTALIFSGNWAFAVADFENIGDEAATHGAWNGSKYTGKQEFLVARPIPEPTTMLLFGFGLLGIGAIGRKKN